MGISGVNVYNDTYITSYGRKSNYTMGKDMVEVSKSAKESSVKPARNVRITETLPYTKEGSNTAVLLEDDKTTFPMVNILSKYSKYIEALNEHYSKVNEENKQYLNPERHIRDKYYNKKSPYYVEGLSNMEREICWKAELDVFNGKPPALNAYDPVIQEKFGGCNIFIMDMEGNQDTREELNNAISQTLKDSGISIPEGANLQLNIDPYDFLIDVNGVEEGLAEQIEGALNKGKNGYYLYQHISLCNPKNYNVEEPYQYILGDKGKMAVYHLVNKLTGYDLRELENRDGRFYTPDGEDLWKALEQKYSERYANGEADSLGLGEYYEDYSRIAKQGFHSSPDSNLGILYKDGSLYDVGTSHGYGPGQKEWQNNVRNWYKGIQNDYQIHRRSALSKDGYGQDTAITTPSELVPSDTAKVLEKLTNLKKAGLLVPLSNKILNLQGEDKDMIPFDSKA